MTSDPITILMAGVGELQHAVREVEADHTRGANSGGKREVSGAAREVENAITRRNRGALDQPRFPAAVLPV